MPRPNKPINNRGPLDAPASSSRAATWTKHGGPETAGNVRGAPSAIEATETVELVVEDITIIESASVDDQLSKWDRRGTAAHIPNDDAVIGLPPRATHKEWVVERSVEGRTYRRTDALIDVADPV